LNGISNIVVSIVTENLEFLRENPLVDHLDDLLVIIPGYRSHFAYTRSREKTPNRASKNNTLTVYHWMFALSKH